jgi:hypothetical protein
MSIKSRNDLKAEFVSGTAATEQKFENIFDSHYNRYEDSVMIGPMGVTGSYGLLGPDGGTYNGVLGPAGSTFYNGLWLSTGSTPGSSAAAGSTGEVVFGSIGATGVDMYINDGSKWIKFSGTTDF